MAPAYVMLCLSFQSKEDASHHEDYGHKAMEFFRGRIEQYGECTAVPIRSLLGEEITDGGILTTG